ncbi:MAG: GerAB/ArcD/ProY family transporter [Selenomonadales bacterium]|nr:GerAB/ArcD/ProY family transporter [Selenomonadales bacterium]
MDRQGDISSQEGGALAAMVILPTVFLLEPSLTIERSGAASYWVKAGGGVLFGALAWWVMLLYRRQSERIGTRVSFAQFAEVCLGRSLARVLLGIWLVMLLAHLALMLRLVAESTAKTALQQSEVLFALVLLVGAMLLGTRYRLTALLRGAYLLLGVTSMLIALLILLLIPMWEVHFLLPWQGYGLGHTLGEIGLDVGSWCAGSVLFLLLPRMRTDREGRLALLGGVGAAMLVKCAFILSALCVFGSVVGGERSFLFYEMAKLVHFSQYIQRVEAVFLCVQMMLVFLSMVLLVRMCAHLMADLLAVGDAYPLVPLLVSLAAVGAGLATDMAFTAEWSEKLGCVGAPLFFVLAVGALSVGCYRRERRHRHAAHLDDRT